MAAKGEGKSKVKKKLAVLALCLFSFVVGLTFHYLYPKVTASLKIKAVQRRDLQKTLKLNKGKLFDVVIIEEKDMGSYTIKLLSFRWQEIPIEAYLLIPHRDEGKMAAVLALHGHHTSKEELVGKKPSRFGVDYGLRLMKAGFCVLVPEIPFSRDINFKSFNEQLSF